MSRSTKPRAAGLAALARAGGARAGGAVLDQSAAPDSSNLLFDLFEFQQVVTDGVGGTLSGLTLYGFNFTFNGQLIFGDNQPDLVRIALDGPGVGLDYLFSENVVLGFEGTFIDTSAAGIQLSPGEQFVIDIQGDGNGVQGSDSTYPGGDLFVIEGSFVGDQDRQGGGALAFQTFVTPPGSTTPSAAPEPGVWALMILGFAGLGAELRRRRTELAAV